MILPEKVRQFLQFDEEVLPSGLTLRAMHMPGFDAAHVVYATKFGSIDRCFEQHGDKWDLPAGVAHFLEHKMFENENGVDAFTLYAKTGAAANAYTSFNQTSYIFTATQEIDKNIDILLSLVGRPHFTAQTIKKEQGIIGQEIKMYDDLPELRAFYALMQSLYAKHPIRDDIGGTVESIADINPEMLFACCKAFYNPGNMVLTGAGNVTMAQMKAAAKRAGLVDKAAVQPAVRILPKEPEEVMRAHYEFTMPVALPILAMGFKETPVRGDELRTQIVCDMLTELVCGETSPLYRRLYDDGLIQPEFEGEFGCFKGVLFTMFSGSVTDTEKVKAEILAEISRLRKEGIDEEQFTVCKNMMYGEAVCEWDSVAKAASDLASSHFYRRTPQIEMEALASITIEEVSHALNTMMQTERMGTVIVQPEPEQ